MAASNPLYKLRCSLYGHSADVRSVVSQKNIPNGSIISGSRDKTAKIWSSNGSNYFEEIACLSGPSNFVSSLCCLPADEKNPKGLIAVGSNDCAIYCFALDSYKPVCQLKGHTGTVSSLIAGKFGTLISGSWDLSVRVWLSEKNIMTLTGHQAAVWSVEIMPEHGIILSASADRTIKAWKAGKCDHTFTGHTDCVRGLSVLNTDEFLSCANDCTIRRWSISSLECLQEFTGHTGFIYSLSVIPNTGGLQFISSSEDRSIRVWNVAGSSDGSNCIQTIRLSAQSIWTSCCLENGDVVAGSSDGIVRIFTTHPELEASLEEQKQLEDELSKTCLNKTDIGGVKISDLPSVEALAKPGKKDGVVIMVREGAVVCAHQWSASESRWLKIGDIVGADESSKKSEKSMHEGKEYDYVFTVDIEEGKPPLQLPYNISEDPWLAAQTFITKNGLPAVYLEQVANFIVENTKGVTLSQGNSTSASDPFTGGNRYVPGSSSSMEVSNSNSSDPFTGSGRYIPSYNNPPAVVHGAGDPFTGNSRYVTQSLSTANNYYPQNKYVKFETGNIAAIFTKLKEFNSKDEVEQKLNETQINHLQEVVSARKALDDNSLDSIRTILKWPSDILFPPLDVLRLALLNEETVKNLINSVDGKVLLDTLLSIISSTVKPTNLMLSIKSLCNYFALNTSEKQLEGSSSDIIGHVLKSCIGKTLNKQLQIAVTTLLLNFAVLFKYVGSSELKIQLLPAIVSVIDFLSEAEAMFRVMVCLGTLIYDDKEAASAAKSYDLLVPVKKFREVIDPSKVGECAGYLEQMLS